MLPSWPPPDIPPIDQALLSRALDAVAAEGLHGAAFGNLRFILEEVDRDCPLASLRLGPQSLWGRQARTWRTVTPWIAEGSCSPGSLHAAVAKSCRHIGLPPPVSARCVPGIANASGFKLGKLGSIEVPKPRRFFVSHLDIAFAEPVPGPVVLGRGRHFGIGLCLPSREAG